MEDLEVLTVEGSSVRFYREKPITIPDRVYRQAAGRAGRLQSNVAYRFLLILSLSKDAHTSHRWFDRLTMSG